VSARVTVDIQGLDQFIQALDKFGADLPRMSHVAATRYADLLLLKTLPSIPKVTGRARSSLEVLTSGEDVTLAAGGTKAPYYAWLAFGGRAGRNHSVFREVTNEDRYVYPAMRKYRSELDQVVQNTFVTFAEDAGLDVT
jgi:hypothetical protein